MIVATAGHIDHGKTALVRALTGIDTDRLPEEKRRGMTVDLGFAYVPLRDGSVLGFVDVPGHERLIRNMLAGVGGIDVPLLVVAADDGPMPQTCEHLAILDLLLGGGGPAEPGRQGAIVVTKVDRVSRERRKAVTEEIVSLVAGTVLAGAPVFAVSSVTGEGIPALREHLQRMARRFHSRAVHGHFRLAVDRCFTLHGTGIVVTGTAFAGSVKVGDRLLLSPMGLPVRVRSLHAQNRPTHAAAAGQRCALNLVGTDLKKELVHRGDWILDEAIHAPTRRLDVRIRLLRAEGAGLRDRAPVHVHLGAADVTGRVALLEGRVLEPGRTGLARILLDETIGALRGDRLVLRDQSAQRTLGGGYVVDPFPPERGRRRPQRLALLTGLDAPDAAAALAAGATAAPEGIDLAAFARAWNLTPAEQGALWRRVPMVRLGEPAVRALSEARWRALRGIILTTLGDWHARHPESIGPDTDRLRRSLPERMSAELFRDAVAELLRAGEVVREAGSLRLPGHRVAMSSRDAALWARVQPMLEAGGLRPPRVREIAERLGIGPEDAEELLRRVARFGLLFRVADNRFFLPSTLYELARIAEALAAVSPDGCFTAAAYKDRSGIGRNLTIELLEFFDQRGFTRREGEGRRILRPAAEAFARP